MENIKTLKNISDLISISTQFVIPYYQRGYIWGKSRGSEKNSVEYMLESIWQHYISNKELFIQGITVCEKDGKIILVDGQQRITFFYLLLKYFNEDKFSIQYDIRGESDTELKHIDKNSSEQSEIKYQDIYYFRKSMRLIREYLDRQNVDGTEFVKWIFEKIKFLYINLPEKEAVRVFTMMNGNKANMLPEEIVKAEMLRMISITEESETNNIALEWDNNMLRNKYAREWDKWLYWWNRNEIRTFYRSGDRCMGWLLEIYYKCNNSRVGDNDYKHFNFENFRALFLKDKLAAKRTFYELRHLQKHFEDTYNDVVRHNNVGAILQLSNTDDIKNFLIEYAKKKNDLDLDKYVKLKFLGLSHTKIMNYFSEDTKAIDEVNSKKEEVLTSLNQDIVYGEADGHAYAQLLRRNIEEDTNLDRCFDFGIWAERSLEHIQPQSKACALDFSIETKLDNGTTLIGGSEHCIGNLVLLYMNENSKFNNKDFSDKKEIYFDTNIGIRSRHLLHSISVFAKNSWGVDEIRKNREIFINELNQYYENI